MFGRTRVEDIHELGRTHEHLQPVLHYPETGLPKTVEKPIFWVKTHGGDIELQRNTLRITKYLEK